MKFDLDKAWNEAVTMLRSNLDVLSVVAGVFYFLPSLALTLLIPTAEIEAAAQDPERFQAAMGALLGQYWPVMAAYFVATVIGSLTLYALLGKAHRPTVGEALKIGLTACIPYIAAMLLFVFAITIVSAAINVIGALSGVTAIAIVMTIISIAVIIFISMRFLLVGPIMAIEQNYNPISALLRSWKLVKGNTRKVTIFMLLVGAAVIVIYIVTAAIIGLFAALLGSGQAALWVEGILSGLLGAAISTIILTIYIAIHRQLAGDPPQTLSDTFE
ncbi:hypothetical protein QWY75_08265 [Pontixanthobacter aestiaquae]|uniref:Glycerophosphoryl diester phosphodiesterase membrane domain-containing protein n=1 Tax=Pontixanthobacter aestiaquae TaxID=1509367 RepID=A0A844ZAC2_9SPHN|nr:hypothetical protein [Pontixanthobacter aestiaquae]MDN3646199.1 hypothetical protein [Pontixanthobacter aestiaquae]MXO82809.1 hypothetical protein [Pontixanthobacter aestiaquae]